LTSKTWAFGVSSWANFWGETTVTFGWHWNSNSHVSVLLQMVILKFFSPVCPVVFDYHWGHDQQLKRVK
jgi:hypothetical protein